MAIVFGDNLYFSNAFWKKKLILSSCFCYFCYDLHGLFSYTFLAMPGFKLTTQLSLHPFRRRVIFVDITIKMLLFLHEAIFRWFVMFAKNWWHFWDRRFYTKFLFDSPWKAASRGMTLGSMMGNPSARIRIETKMFLFHSTAIFLFLLSIVSVFRQIHFCRST